MTAEPPRAAFRRQVREAALDEAEALAVELGWDRVRFSHLATATGVSRPTLYKEFGDKQGLGEALVARETERFLVGVHAALTRTRDVGTGIREAVAYACREADRSPLLHAVLTSTRADQLGLLPLLTTRSAPLLEAAGAVVVAWLSQVLPRHAEDDLVDAADALVRLVVSHLVQPTGTADATAERLSRVALRLLRL